MSIQSKKVNINNLDWLLQNYNIENKDFVSKVRQICNLLNINNIPIRHFELLDDSIIIHIRNGHYKYRKILIECNSIDIVLLYTDKDYCDRDICYCKYKDFDIQIEYIKNYLKL